METSQKIGNHQVLLDQVLATWWRIGVLLLLVVSVMAYRTGFGGLFIAKITYP